MDVTEVGGFPLDGRDRPGVTAPVNGRVSHEPPVGRIQAGWVDGKAVYADVYPSDVRGA